MPSISDFSKGDKVRFGRGNGEQTLGTVVKVNRTRLKVRQDESRGTYRSYPVGTIWTVPPSLCVKVESGTERVIPRSRPTPVATRQDASFSVGSRVEFDHAGGVITGTVKRVNRKSITVTPDDNPSRWWRVHPSLLRLAGSAPASQSAPSRLPLAVGQTVTYQGFSWSARGLTQVTGVVTKVNHSKGTYEVCHGHRVTTEKASDVTEAPRRSDADIVDACLAVYGALSPENLCMDGEASRTYVRRRSAELNRALQALWTEARRRISEDECYRALDSRRIA